MNDPIEDALRTYPLAELPPNFSKGVMRQIRPSYASLKFRLTWLDYALGFFLSLLPLAWFVARATLPPQFLMRVQYQWLLLRSPAFEPVLITGIITLAVLLILVAAASLRYLFQPNYQYR
ncbi:MAG: hypothetical protein EHM81_12085 [Chloroflexi bacterium]|nr:MAG: hypothetical protein EHM81_12085 [Chloroflexota bacterium]